MGSAHRVYQFGDFLLDRDERVLCRGTSTVPLTPKATDILLALVDRRGHIVEKADLMRLVWPDTAVEESNLTQNIYTLRKVLGDAGGKCPFIETVPRRGYRFVGSVREITGQPAHAEVSGAITANGDAVHQTPPVEVATLGSHAKAPAVFDSALEVIPAAGGDQSKDRRTARQLIGRVALPLAIGGIATALFWVTSNRPRVAHSASELMPRLARITSIGTVVRAAISRDGRSVAYAVSAGPRESLWIKALDSGNQVQLIEPAVGTYRRSGGLSYAPNGWVYYAWFRPDLAHTGIYRIPQQGGQAEPLRNIADLPSFDPGGDRLACISTHSTIRESRLLVYGNAGEVPRIVAMRAPPSTFLQMPPAWSSDGKQLAVWAMDERYPTLRDLVIVNVDDGRERVVTKQQLHTVDGIVWLPDGSSVIVAAREHASSPLRLWQIPLAAPVMRPVTTDISDYLLAGLTEAGRRLAAVRVDVTRSLWVAPVTDPARAREIGSDTGELFELESVEWMPDGRLLYTSTESGNADIWVYDPAGDKPRRLTTNPGDDFSPTSSPDGRTIIFASDRSGATGLWTMSKDGESSVRQLTNSGDSRPGISPDAGVVFQRGIIQSSPVTLWRIPAEGGDAVQLTHGVSIRPAVSPDGRLVAHYWLTPERWTLAVVPMKGGQPLQVFPLSSTHCGRTVRWSPDGRALAYIDCAGGVGNIWLQPLDGGPARALTHFRSGHVATFDWSRDGSQFAWIRRSQLSDVVLIELSGLIY